MSISATVRHYLETRKTPYELVFHSRSYTSMETAESAHIPGDRLVKSVVVESESSYAIVVLPSTHRIDLESMQKHFGRPFRLAKETEIRALFKDCEVGSIPPFGQMYGVDVLVDDSLRGHDDIYFEAGDHEELVRVSGSDFGKLIGVATHGPFARHA